jgi:hypothetical protein
MPSPNLTFAAAEAHARQDANASGAWFPVPVDAAASVRA